MRSSDSVTRLKSSSRQFSIDKTAVERKSYGELNHNPARLEK